MAGRKKENGLKANLYQAITNQLVEAIENGCPPWRQPWAEGAENAYLPLRHNDEPYQGVNVLVLWLVASARQFITLDDL